MPRQAANRTGLAGRYNPVEPFPEFPVDLSKPSPGAGHATIQEALEDSDADGTRSIFDVPRISAKPDYDAVAPVPEEELMDYFGATKPSLEEVENCEEMFEQIERGQGIYVVVYEREQPSQIYFAGYSYD